MRFHFKINKDAHCLVALAGGHNNVLSEVWIIHPIAVLVVSSFPPFELIIA